MKPSHVTKERRKQQPKPGSSESGGTPSTSVEVMARGSPRERGGQVKQPHVTSKKREAAVEAEQQREGLLALGGSGGDGEELATREGRPNEAARCDEKEEEAAAKAEHQRERLHALDGGGREIARPRRRQGWW